MALALHSVAGRTGCFLERWWSGVRASSLWVMELSSHLTLSLDAVTCFSLGGQGPGVSEWGHHLGIIVIASVALSVLFKNVNIICLPPFFTLFYLLCLYPLRLSLCVPQKNCAFSPLQLNVLISFFPPGEEYFCILTFHIVVIPNNLA